MHAGDGVPEDPGKTLRRLSETATATVHNVRAPSIAEGLVSTAAENGRVLVIGSSRTRRLRQWLFGSTPDRVVELAEDAGVPVIVYASSVGIPAGSRTASSPSTGTCAGASAATTFGAAPRKITEYQLKIFE